MPAQCDMQFYDCNNQGQAVGKATASGVAPRGILYDPARNPTAALDLNDITLGIPEGYYLKGRLGGINEAGLIGVMLSEIGVTSGLSVFPGVVDAGVDRARVLRHSHTRRWLRQRVRYQQLG